MVTLEYYGMGDIKMNNINADFDMPDNFVAHLQDYYAHLIGKTISDNEFEKLYDDNTDKAEIINQILSIEQAYYLMRRCRGGGLCGSHSDILWRIRRKLIDELRKEFDEEYIDVNKDIRF